MTDTVRQVVDLGAPPWPTVDPFLFCVHHVDAYPAGNERLGPTASLAGRNLGNDFAGIDGWRMYHGRDIPGFPPHPHRGFETVTVVRRGVVDHADSLGAAARFGAGDVQWLTAGAGIVHSEMFPLLRRDEPNPLELFQIWLNLPRADKMAPPHFSMLWRDTVPRVETTGPHGERAAVTVVAGSFGGAVAPAPPPHSWASRPDADVAIWTLELAPGAAVELPSARGDATVRTLYVFGQGAVDIGPDEVRPGQAAVVRAERTTTVRATGDAPADVLVLQGRPIGEPVAQYGPFVLNDRAGIEQAFADYQRTQFGGWPWPDDDPVHAADEARFARHADGRVERPAG